MRKKKPKKPLKKWQKILYDILFLIALGVFIYSGYQLYHIYSQNHAEEKEKIELQQLSNICLLYTSWQLPCWVPMSSIILA